MEHVAPVPLTLDAAAKAQLESFLPPQGERSENGAWPHQIYPHVTLTYAQSIDAQISLQAGAQTVLSGPETKAMTHYLRSRHDAIMVGIGTAKADNPGLNTRYSEDGKEIVGMERQPRPLVLDPSGRWHVDDTPKLFSLVHKREGKAPWWFFCAVDRRPMDLAMVMKVENAGGKVIDAGAYRKIDDGVDWDVVLRRMAMNGVRSVMIEGGGAVIKDLLKKRNQKYISSVIVTVAPTYLGAGGVYISPRRSVQTENEVNLKFVKWIPLGQDVIMAGVIGEFVE